jgi:pimeloyl-ACP methyl ester carboxylesterase
MTSIFQSPQAKAVLSGWYEQFRARLKVPTHSHEVATRFGPAHVLIGGHEQAPSVVVLHGAMASSAHALVELEPLLHHFRVYAVDVVGQSVKSADARPSVSNNEYGQWLVDVLDGLGLERTNVVGISWGGFVALRLAAQAPARIARLALLVPAGVVTGPAWAGFWKVGLPVLKYRWAPTEARRKAFIEHLLTTTDDDWGHYLGDAMRSFTFNMKVPALARPEELAGFTAPVLVFGADGDLSFPGQQLLARARELFQTLQGAELIRNSRHCPPTTDAFRGWLGERLTGFFAPG